MSKTTTNHNGADKRQELARLQAAGERLVERARQDPEVAREFLRDIGYFAVMDKANAVSSPPNANGSRQKKVAKSKTARIKPQPIKSQS